jgi:hypothetical protein
MTIPWHAFGSNLESLIREQPARLHNAVAISPLGGTAPRAFRLQFSDGRVLKGRYLETAQQGETVWRLSNAHLGSAPVGRIIAWRSEALLEEWLPDAVRKLNFPKSMRWAEGGPLKFARPISWLCEIRSPARARAALDRRFARRRPTRGRWAARSVAAREAVAGDSQRPRLPSGDSVTAISARRICSVPALGLRRRQRDDLRAVAGRQSRPNLVSLAVDTLAFGAFRWLPPASRTDDFLAHFPFWTIAMLLQSAVFRLRNGVS